MSASAPRFFVPRFLFFVRCHFVDSLRTQFRDATVGLNRNSGFDEILLRAIRRCTTVRLNMGMNLVTKLAILADAAKYDASCASSGTTRRNSRGGGIGSTTGTGICHSYTPDGRCVSLLKILLTNFCIYDCLYCINRRSSTVQRARFTPEEVVQLTLDFYRRNYIEGLFLSSGIIRDPDYTMEQVVCVARRLRVDHQFRGYIHLKTIPEAAPELIAEAGKWADRLSINVEDQGSD